MHRTFAVSVLVLLAGCQGSSEGRSPATEALAPPAVRFVSLDAERTGVDFVNKLPEAHPQANVVAYQYFYNGAGVAIGDVNGDDLPDLFFAGNLVPDRLYLNRGDLKFEDVSAASGVQARAGWSTGVSMVDIDADGDLDIVVARSGKVVAEALANLVWINDGTGTFTEGAANLGLADTGYSQQVAFLDYDRDGDLDAYVLNHPIQDTTQSGRSVKELASIPYPQGSDRLYRNDGARFVDVSAEAGIENNAVSYGLSVSVGDLDDDGYPDLYVTNDYFEHDYVYMKQRDGTFRDVVQSAMPHISQFSMGSDIADLDNDGRLDVLVADMAAPDNYRQKTMMQSMNVPRFRSMILQDLHYQYSFNTLQRNNGDGTFSDVAQLAGLARTDWSWTALAFDFDNDGWRDVFVTNGRRKDSSNVDMVRLKAALQQQGRFEGRTVQEFIRQMPDGRVANQAFRNEGDLSFANVSTEGGLGFVGASNGAAYGDLDGDGDLDLVVNNIDDPASIYDNQAPTQHRLQIDFTGPPRNPLGLGTRVTVVHGDRKQVAEHYLSRGYQSSMAPGLHFGLGASATVDEVRVRWADGKTQLLRDVPADTPLTVEWNAPAVDLPAPRPPAPLLADITETSGLAFIHEENDFDDLAREILLPYETSKLGPAMAVGDVQGDGLSDVYFGGALGQAGTLYVQDADGRFAVVSGPWTAHADREDVVARFFDADGDGDADLYVGSGGNEPAADAPELQDRLYLNDGGQFRDASQRLPALRTSTGAVAAGDVDGDGDQDLFVGGRLVPGRYPLPARSVLLRNDGDRFVDATEEWAPELAEPGLVTTATFADTDADGDLDLIVGGEWMPLLVATNEGGRLAPEAMPNSEGWWRSAALLPGTAGDTPTIVAGNVGRSIKFRASLDAPFKVYAKDFDDSGTLDIVLAWQSEDVEYPVRGRECSSQQMPFIKKKFASYDAFGRATLRDVYGDDLDAALALRANTFESTLWTREGDSWTAQALPALAQIGAGQGIVIHDFDGDGNEDLLMAGNLEKTEVETPRIDGGTGLVLLASDAGYRPLLPVESGFQARGDVKRVEKVALAGDATGVIVARNDGPVSLFRVTR